MPIQTTNPTTNEVVKSFEEIDNKTLNEAVEKADNAFKKWRKTSYDEREKLLRKVATLLRQKKDILSKLITLEMGKPIAQSIGEIELSADIFDYYARNSVHFLADKKLNPALGTAFIRYYPIGALLGVQPWNFPFYQVARFAASNIMAGNTILLKHASIVPQCGIDIGDIFKEAGAAEGVYTNILISGKRATTLVADKRIKGVSLTGSEEAGASIAAEAGKYLKKSVLELGGNDAFIILVDADMDKTVEWAMVGRMNNNGECCIASKRIIAVEEIADEFLEKLIKKMGAMKVGDPMDAATQLGPMSSEAAAKIIVDQIKRSIDAGATLLMGGKRIEGIGAFVQPTILTDIEPDNPAYSEEIFGPVVSFFKVKNEQAAIDLANNSSFGLGGSVFTKDEERGRRVADQIDTGMVFINHPTWTQADLPFGGTKGSGYGRELSALGIEEFVNKKLIRTSDIDDPF